MKIIIADPQARVRHGLRILLEQQRGWVVDGEATDYRELVELLRVYLPDILLIDWDLPDLPEAYLLRLRAQNPDIVVIMMSWKPELCQAALQAGADAFASKTDTPEKLLSVIRSLQDRNYPAQVN